MLGKDKICVLIFLGLLLGCNNNLKENQEKKYKDVAINLMGFDNYNEFYEKVSDTLKSWYLNDLLGDTIFKENSKKIDYIVTYKIDSTICINSSMDKYIGVVLKFNDGFIKDTYLESIKEFFGAKINGEWYFWTGGEMAVSRKLFENHPPTKPLSYAQLHEQAMNNFLGGYLTKDGEINDKWF